MNISIVDIVSGIEEFKILYKDAADNVNNATTFWNIYNPQPNELLRSQQYLVLRERMFKLLMTCKQIDQEAFAKIHKGHPYFFIGITSYRLGDYQTSILFFDAALSEDLKFKKEEDSPTRLFFMLKGEEPRNAARLDTQYVETKVKRSINYYNDDIAKNKDINKINLKDMQDVFFEYVLDNSGDPGLRTMLTTYITYIVEWDFRNEHFDLGVRKGTSEPYLLHLFRGCVLFESLLKRNPFPKPKHEDQKKELGKLLRYYQNEMKVKLPDDFTSKITGINTLGKLLTELNNQSEVIEDSILTTYWLRNILGHSLAWEDRIEQESYRKLYFSVSTSCLHVINCLWRNPQLKYDV